MPPFELATIGAGNMAEGVVRGILGAGIIAPERLIAMDPDPKRRKLFAEQFGIPVTDDATYAAAESETILLAVKPQVFSAAAAAFVDHVRDDHLIISIMAGVPTERVEAAFAPKPVRVVRVMPNLPMTVGAGMAAACRGRQATSDDVAYVSRLFEAAAKVIVLDDEKHMDAVTAVSGSGPAYYYLFTEAIADGGVRAGLPEETARLLAIQTCLGAAQMMQRSGELPSVLREKVTSKGGTTAAALESLYAHDVPEHIAEAVLAAARRGRELAK